MISEHDDFLLDIFEPTNKTESLAIELTFLYFVYYEDVSKHTVQNRAVDIFISMLSFDKFKCTRKTFSRNVFNSTRRDFKYLLWNISY